MGLAKDLFLDRAWSPHVQLHESHWFLLVMEIQTIIIIRLAWKYFTLNFPDIVILDLHHILGLWGNAAKLALSSGVFKFGERITLYFQFYLDFIRGIFKADCFCWLAIIIGCIVHLLISLLFFSIIQPIYKIEFY